MPKQTEIKHTPTTVVSEIPKDAVLAGSQSDSKASLGLIQATLNKDWKNVDQNTRVRFVARLCNQLNISPVLNPFKFIDIKGVTVLYAPAPATSLIANANKISQEILKEVYDKEKQILKIYIRSSQADGRFTDEYASLYLGSNSGEARANLEMKCLTKAKRRGVLAMVNMSIPDEDELQYLERASAEIKPVEPTKIHEVIDNVEKEDVDEARMELMDLVTQGDSKAMSILKKFIAAHTNGKQLSELTYDECHSLMDQFNYEMQDLADKTEIKKPEPSQDNDVPEEHQDALWPSPENNKGL